MPRINVMIRTRGDWVPSLRMRELGNMTNELGRVIPLLLCKKPAEICLPADISPGQVMIDFAKFSTFAVNTPDVLVTIDYPFEAAAVRFGETGTDPTCPKIVRDELHRRFEEWFRGYPWRPNESLPVWEIAQTWTVRHGSQQPKKSDAIVW